jgi:hypothetical protein
MLRKETKERKKNMKNSFSLREIRYSGLQNTCLPAGRELPGSTSEPYFHWPKRRQQQLNSKSKAG